MSKVSATTLGETVINIYGVRAPEYIRDVSVVGNSVQNKLYLHSFYKNNFKRTRASNLPKIEEQAKNKLRLTHFEEFGKCNQLRVETVETLDAGNSVDVFILVLVTY